MQNKAKLKKDQLSFNVDLTATKYMRYLVSCYAVHLPCEQRDTVVSSHTSQHADAGQLV